MDNSNGVVPTGCEAAGVTVVATGLVTGGIVAGVEYRSGVARTVAYPDELQLVEPVDQDEWLRNMHELTDA